MARIPRSRLINTHIDNARDLPRAAVPDDGCLLRGKELRRSDRLRAWPCRRRLWPVKAASDVNRPALAAPNGHCSVTTLRVVRRHRMREGARLGVRRLEPERGRAWLIPRAERMPARSLARSSITSPPKSSALPFIVRGSTRPSSAGFSWSPCIGSMALRELTRARRGLQRRLINSGHWTVFLGQK